jgi:hypothetical protein
MNVQNMLVYSADWHGEKTFRMLPVTKECPFNEVIFDPETKVLAIISKELKEKPHMFAKLNTTGKPMYDTSDKKVLLEERIIMDTYYEYYLDDVKDIKYFILRFAINKNHDALNVIDEVIKEE